MSSITLLDLRTRARDRANQENSLFVSDSILNSYINYAVSDLRDILSSKAGEDYFATSSTFTIGSGQESVALPSDFYKLLWAEVQLDGGSSPARYQKINRFEPSEQSYNIAGLSSNSVNLRYRLRADTIWFNSAEAASGRTVRLWYVPVAPMLTSNAQELNGYNGWDEYVVLLAARKAMIKEEQDVSDLDKEILVFNQRLEGMAPNRDQGQPMRIYDNERNSRDYGLDGLND